MTRTLAQRNNELLGGAHNVMQHAMELVEIGYVEKHLRKHGFAAYLPTLTDRIAGDIKALMSHGWTEEQAMTYLGLEQRGNGSATAERQSADG